MEINFCIDYMAIYICIILYCLVHENYSHPCCFYFQGPKIKSTSSPPAPPGPLLPPGPGPGLRRRSCRRPLCWCRSGGWTWTRPAARRACWPGRCPCCSRGCGISDGISSKVCKRIVKSSEKSICYGLLWALIMPMYLLCGKGRDEFEPVSSILILGVWLKF